MTGRSTVQASTTSRKVVLAVMAVLSVALSGAALAYACTPNAAISISPSGPVLPGTQLNVAGIGFAGNVTVRWGSASGAVLATATTQASFGATITVPDAAPGPYFVVAVARDAAGGFVGQASASVEVTARPQAPVAAAPSQPAGSGAAAATAAPAAADDSPAAPAPARTPDAGRPAAQQTSRPAAAQTPRPAARPAPARPAAQQRPNARTHAQPAPRPAPAAPRRFFDTPVTAAVTAPPAAARTGTTARTGTQRAASKPARPAPAPDANAGRPATQPAPAASATPAPSLDSPVSAGQLPQRDHSGSRLAIGIGMLALSLAALFGSFLVADVRRRRAPLRSRDSQ
ncbi:MAG TPA: hypothetical protein VL120_05845 [Solirubrobacteraceae bacterium]|nr:hypothetical protein [Solirubrobacteraceae bacterium]